MKQIELISNSHWSNFLVTNVNRCRTTHFEVVPQESKNRCTQFLQFTISYEKSFIINIWQGPLYSPPLQTNHVYSTLKRRGNNLFHVVSTWNTPGVFLGSTVGHSCVQRNVEPVT